MSTTATHDAHIDRKSIKRPDDFFMAVKRFFDDLAKNSKAVAVVLALVLVLVAGLALYQSQKDQRAGLARSELFLAKKAVEKDLIAAYEATPEWTARAAKERADREKAEAKAAQGKDKDKEKVKDKASKSKASEEIKPTLDDVAFIKIDVDAKLSSGRQKLESLIQKFPGTRAAFEARMALGDLYFNHGDPTLSLKWYESAVPAAPSAFERALAYYAQGYALEASSKLPEAVQSFERALGMGETGLRSELLLSIARVQMARGQKDEARKSLDRVVSEFAGTDEARSAETMKAEL